MKILYLTPRINNEGGVARILAVKTNLFIEKLGFEIAIATQNKGNSPLFFDFNPKIQFFDFELKGTSLGFISDYKKSVNSILKNYNPDVVIITDNGLKGYLFKYLISCNKPVIFEVHGSKYNSQTNTNVFFKKIVFQLQVYLREKGLEKFDKVVFLSEESRQQWNFKKGEVIPNINWIETTNFSSQEYKIALCVARNSYEKGLDRLFSVWKEISQKQPDWKLRLVTETEGYYNINDLITQNNLKNSVEVVASEKNILQCYTESSIYLMTSHNEGMPMVLIEAMSVGLPIIAYDCPIGPKSMITNNEDGFLIENNNVTQFVSQALIVMNDKEKRIVMGKNAIKSTEKYKESPILEKWKQLLENLKS